MLTEKQINYIYHNSHGLPSGRDRFVYPVSSDVVIKLPIGGDTYQSHMELTFYEEILQPRQSHLVARLIDYFILCTDEMFQKEEDSIPVLYFERVEPLDPEVLDELDIMSLKEFCMLFYGEYEGLSYYYDLLDFCDETNLEDVIDHFPNWGITNDYRLVCIDCGEVRYDC